MFPNLFANDDLPHRPPGRRPIKVAFDQFDHMREHAAWWDEARRRLVWHPIGGYEREASDLLVGSLTLLRSNHQWVLAILTTEGWAKVTEGASYRLDHFKPIEWAEPALDDVMLLMQE